MCIVAIAWQLFDELPLVLLSNRDEFLQRPTELLHQWEDKPVFAGRDVQSGGTWLGIHQQPHQANHQDGHQVPQRTFYQQNGRWAAVLNFRDGVQASSDERSRGALVTDFLTSDISPMKFARQISLQNYAGFNLIIGDMTQKPLLSIIVVMLLCHYMQDCMSFPMVSLRTAGLKLKSCEAGCAKKYCH